MSPSLRRGFLFVLLLWSTAPGRQRLESRVAVSTDSCQRRPDDCGQSGQTFQSFRRRSDKQCQARSHVTEREERRMETKRSVNLPPPLDLRHDREVPLLAEAPVARAKKAVLAAAQPSKRRQRRKWCGCESEKSGHSWSHQRLGKNGRWAVWPTYWFLLAVLGGYLP